MGGYVTRYANDFDFLTIRGSVRFFSPFEGRLQLYFPQP
jgi:hypothetical protein